MDLALLVLRVVVGLLFIGHGSQKLFGSLGGGGRAGTAGFFGTVGLQPAAIMAVLAGLSELTGGVLIALGLLTPLGALLIAAVMFTAILSVHWPRVWNSEGGLEYPLVNVAALFAVTTGGPGAWSLDALTGLPESWGVAWSLGSVLLALSGASAVVLLGRQLESRAARAATARLMRSDWPGMQHGAHMSDAEFSSVEVKFVRSRRTEPTGGGKEADERSGDRLAA